MNQLSPSVGLAPRRSRLRPLLLAAAACGAVALAVQTESPEPLLRAVDGALSVRDAPAPASVPAPGPTGAWTGSDPVATGPATESCEFARSGGGMDYWNELNSLGAYDAACSDAWSAMRAAGYVDETRYPTPAAPDRRLVRGDRLQDPDVKAALGPGLQHWWRWSTRPLLNPEGVRFELHFYRNEASRRLYLGRDYVLVFAAPF